MKTSGFKRTIENFTCGHCGKRVKGNGYTNHCPKCLWSKHVDTAPGDRANPCQGMMKPVGFDYEKNEYHLIFRCVKCGEIKRNKSAPEDSFDDILKLVKKP